MSHFFICSRVGVCTVGVKSLVKCSWQTLSVVQSYTVSGHEPKRPQAHIMMSHNVSYFHMSYFDKFKDVLLHSKIFSSQEFTSALLNL